MVKYNLYVGNERIDFSHIGLDNFYDLNDIDTFTSRFKNEVELKKFLVATKLLKENNEYKTYIEYSYGHIRRLDIMYKSQTCFVAPLDLEASYYKIQDSILAYFDDKDFLRKLYSYLKAHANSNAYIIRNCILGADVTFNEKNEIVSDICESTMIKYKDGEVVYNYKSLRDFGMFMYNYCEKEEIKKGKELEESIFKPYEGEQLKMAVK